MFRELFGEFRARVGLGLALIHSRCTSACEHDENCASKHTSRAALRLTRPGPPPSRLSTSEQPRAELVAVGWNVPCAKWYAARWNAWNASIDAVVDGKLCGDQEGGAVYCIRFRHLRSTRVYNKCDIF